MPDLDLVINRQIETKDIVGEEFIFGRVKFPVCEIYTKFKFSHDGFIVPKQHPNETSYKFNSGDLDIITETGELSTRFNLVYLDVNKNVKLLIAKHKLRPNVYHFLMDAKIYRSEDSITELVFGLPFLDIEGLKVIKDHENIQKFSLLQLNIHNYINIYGVGHLCFSRGYIYGQTAKNASTTIFKILDYIADLQLKEINTYGVYTYTPSSNLDFPYDDVLNNRSFKFMVSRNPFVRALSAYKDKIANRTDYFWERYYLKTEMNVDLMHTFNDFLNCVKNKMVKYGVAFLDEHFRPQWALNLAEVIPYDFIGKLENFPQDLQYIMDRLGVRDPIETFYSAPHATNAKDKLLEYYDEECVQLVREIYAKDFELFGYSTDFPPVAPAPSVYPSFERTILEDEASPSIVSEEKEGEV